MQFFQRMNKYHASVQKTQPKPQAETQNSFLLEPILTPSAGIDGTEGLPEMAIAQWTLPPLPDIDGFDSDFSDAALTIDSNAVEYTEVGLESIAFIDTIPTPDFLPQDGIFESGVFHVGASGDVSIDYLFDGGMFEGELAIFSLDSMQDLEAGSDAFIREAARRALSDSPLGHIVISDATDAAKFSGNLAWEGDFNSGDYQGVQTFAMRAGDRLGFMLVSNSTVQAVFENPGDDGIRPLFSMATANPNNNFQAGQIADVTGDGNTFVFEDLRVDGHSDRDYNDVVFQVRGATTEAIQLDYVIDSDKDWRTSDLGQAIVAYAEPYITPDREHDYHGHTHPGHEHFEGGETELEVPQPEPILTEADGYDFAAANQPLIGVIDTGVNGNNPHLNYEQIVSGYDWVDGDTDSRLQPLEGNEHGTHIVGTLSSLNDDAPIWVGRGVGSGQWANSLVEFVDAAKASGQPNAIANLSFDLAQLNPDDTVSTRYELTQAEWAALEYAHRNNVIVIVAAGNEGGQLSALGQASQLFDNIVTVGSAQQVDSTQSISTGFDRAIYSNYGAALSLVADGGTPDNPMLAPVEEGMGTMSGTSVATTKVTGAISQVWAANPQLSYQQVIAILKATTVDLNTPNADLQTGAGLVNLAAAVHLAKATTPLPTVPKTAIMPDTWAEAASAMERTVSITSVNFSGRVISTINANVRSGPGTSFAVAGRRAPGAVVAFDAWTVGQFVDYRSDGLGASDRWYRVAGTTNQWISAAIISGGPPVSPPVNPPDNSVTIDGFTIRNPFLPVWRQYESTLRRPISNVYNHSSGASYQLFQGGSIVTSAFGTFPLYGAIRQRYLRENGLNGWMGAPKSAEYNWQGLVRQDFANGYIVWNGRTATVYRNGTSNPNPGQPTPIDPGKFYKPLSRYTVTSEFGGRRYLYNGRWVTDFHTGIDLAAPTGTPVAAAKGGTVVSAGWNTQGYGNLVVLEHSNGVRTYYAHLSSISVQKGQTVTVGQTIARVGSTGQSTGPHLHFEVRVAPYRWQTDNRNPRNYIQF